MARAEAPKATQPIRDLKLVEYLILLVVGQHRKRARPVFLDEIRYEIKPAPLDEPLDDLGHMGLLRNAQNDRDQPIRGSVFVDARGWTQVFNQKRRVLRKAKQEAAALRSKAETTRKPEDPTRKKDPAGADEFERQADAIDKLVARIERMCADILPGIPVSDSVRRTADLEPVDASNEALNETQADTTEEELDAADPRNMSVVQVDAPVGGGDGLGEMMSDDEPGPEQGEEEPPAPRRRRK